jgi:GNAT superfamily N-acetyltransferase
MEKIVLRLMTSADVGAADALRALAGWNQLPKDWERLLAHDPRGCFIAECDGTPLGTATTTSYGKDLAWIGMVLVHPEHRRRGIGRALLRHCLKHLDANGVSCVKLDATPLGKTVYDQLDFHDEWSLTRWHTDKRDGEALFEAGFSELTPWSKQMASWVDELDMAAFGVSRRRMLEALRGQSRSAFVIGGELNRGYGMLRDGARASYLGPVVASSPDAGLPLVRHLIASSPQKPIFWDIPDANAPAVALARELGFSPQRPLMRMFRGENKHPGNTRFCYAIADPSIG